MCFEDLLCKVTKSKNTFLLTNRNRIFMVNNTNKFVFTKSVF